MTAGGEAPRLKGRVYTAVIWVRKSRNGTRNTEASPKSRAPKPRNRGRMLLAMSIVENESAPHAS